MSRSLGLSIFDRNGKEMKVQNNPIEFFIPRDSNMEVGGVFDQNVSLIKNSKRFLWNYHLVNLTTENENLTYSIHFELHPLNFNLSYLLIYQFDNQIDSMNNWTVFCSDGKIYFLFWNF